MKDEMWNEFSTDLKWHTHTQTQNDLKGIFECTFALIMWRINAVLFSIVYATISPYKQNVWATTTGKVNDGALW